ncbi:DUF2285 domain-containing protein [Foliimonas ilicis]
MLLNEDTHDRLHALDRFWRSVSSNGGPPDGRITPQRRLRLRMMLQALDGRDEGATYRSIAEALFPRHTLHAGSWAVNSIRETTIRLVRDGVKLVRGGYRDLLRYSRRS